VLEADFFFWLQTIIEKRHEVKNSEEWYQG